MFGGVTIFTKLFYCERANIAVCPIWSSLSLCGVTSTTIGNWNKTIGTAGIVKIVECETKLHEYKGEYII